MNPARKTIEVTRNDIWKGQPRNAYGCPISRALQRQFPGRDIRVLHDYAYIGEHYARMPRVATRFVETFDTMTRLRHFKRPFTFSLEFLPQIKPAKDYVQDPYYDSVMEEQAR